LTSTTPAAEVREDDLPADEHELDEFRERLLATQSGGLVSASLTGTSKSKALAQHSNRSSLLGPDTFPDESTAFIVTTVGPMSRQYVIVEPYPSAACSSKIPSR
jgi:hypothetical protein